MNRVDHGFPFENKCQTCIDFHTDFMKQIEFFNNQIYKEQCNNYELQRKYEELLSSWHEYVHKDAVLELKAWGQNVAI